MNVQKIDTRTQIMRQAIALFASKGFEATTFSDIAKKCKISQPAIYNHFANKMDLLKGCALYSAEMGRTFIDSKAQPHLPASKRLPLYFHSNMEWFSSAKNYGNVILALYFFAYSDEAIRVLHDRIVDSAVERIKGILISGQHEGAWKIKDPAVTARMLHSLLVGEVYKFIYETDSRGLEKATDDVWKFAKMLLNG